MVRFEGRLLGNRGERKGEAGADVDPGVFLGTAGTLRLRFLAFRGRLGGDGDRCELSGNTSSGIVVGDNDCQSL
jgi:hypothetical protein